MSSTPLIIGRFGKSFGILGWIKVISFTTPSENILDFKPWVIQVNGVWEEVYIEDGKKHSSNIIVKLPNYSSPEAVRQFTNSKIGVWRKQLPKLKDNEFYWSDLYGLEVVNKEGVHFGLVKDIYATGANDVLVIEGKKRCLIPYLSSVIINVDLSNKIIKVDWPEDFL